MWHRLSFLVLLTWLSLPVLASEPADGESSWTRFRGPNGTGVVKKCAVPLPWQEKHIAWSTDLPGEGNSSPVFADGRIFLLSADPGTAERYVLAIDLKTGEEVWRRTYTSKPYRIHSRSSFASSTPCVHDGRVFVSWATPENVSLMAFTVDGDEIWARELGPYSSSHGYGASPIVVNGKLILFNSQATEQLPKGVQPGKSRVMAFDPATGDESWVTDTKTTRACYGAPVVHRVKEQTQLLFSNTGNGIFALDADSGALLWEREVFRKRTVSSPIIVGDLVLGTEGSGGGGKVVHAVSLSGEHEAALKIDRSAPYVPSLVAKGNLLFMWSDQGIVTCCKMPSGDVLWSKRIGGNVSTSPVIAANKLIGISEDGTVTILAAAPKYRSYGSIKLSDTTRATPALSESFVLIRTDSKLLCIGRP